METYPGSTDEAHPELFNMDAMPDQPKVNKPGQLSQEKIQQFFREVCIIIIFELYDFINDEG